MAASAVYPHQALVDEANALCLARDWPNAEAAIRRVLAAGETGGFVWAALAGCLSNLNRGEEAVRASRKALLADPSFEDVHSRLILILDTLPKVTTEQRNLERTRWWKSFGAARYAARLPHANGRDPERKLRVGYVSGDFCLHSASFSFGHLILGHGPGVEPILYSTVPHDKYDRITEVYQAELPWRDIHRASDDDFAAMVREDGIDILVDMACYTEGNRLRAFCSKPAPVQISAWGYGLGTGLPCMDALFTDPVMFPPELRVPPIEAAIDLPCAISYGPPPTGVWPVSPQPCLDQAPTFGVFQRASKVDDTAIRAWAEIVRRVPGSRLLMQSGSYDDGFKAHVRAIFGEAADRIEFAPLMAHPDHMRLHDRIDLALDTFAQGGGITTMEAAWMGVPTVTLLGKHAGGRIGASILLNLNLPQFVARSVDEYVEIAVQAVTEKKDALAGIREGLRARLEASPICAGYVEKVEEAYRALWRSWCETGD